MSHNMRLLSMISTISRILIITTIKIHIIFALFRFARTKIMEVIGYNALAVHSGSIALVCAYP